jgi:DNA-binding response OmpR family regulator
LIEYMASSRSSIPLLVLSQRSTISDRILGLEKGADDYLAKPFSASELLLRMKKLLSKTKQLDSYAMRVGEVTLYPQRGTVEVRERKVHLRKKEFLIFAFLVRHKNTVMNRETIIQHVWGDRKTPSDTTVDVYIRRIRLLLGKNEKVIRTVRGYGYIVKDDM